MPMTDPTMQLSHGWMGAAACAEADPELFFPAGFGAAYREQIAAARAVCSPCEVQDECLRTALALNERFGIWGGLTPQERRRLARAGRYDDLERDAS